MSGAEAYKQFQLDKSFNLSKICLGENVLDEKLTSGRKLTGIVESPPTPITESQSVQISNRLAKPAITLNSMANGTKAHDKISLLIASKLGDSLVAVGLKELMLAQVLYDALNATRTTTLCKDEKGDPVTIKEPDHRIRLTAFALLSKLAGYEQPTRIELKHEHSHKGIMAHINGKTLQELEAMENRLALASVKYESENGNNEMGVHSGNGGP